MKYLIKYHAYTDTGNGYCVTDHSEIKEDLEELCKEIAMLESYYKDDEYFKYDIYELQECNVELVTTNQIYLDFKKKLNHEQSIRDLKEKINLKRFQISEHKYTKDKYGKWEKYDEQITVMTKELNQLENELVLELNIENLHEIDED